MLMSRFAGTKVFRDHPLHVATGNVPVSGEAVEHGGAVVGDSLVEPDLFGFASSGLHAVQERELELIDGFFELEGAWSFGCEPVDFPVEQRERVLFPFSFAEEDPHLKKSRVDEWRNRTTNGQRDLLVEAEQSMEPRAVAAEQHIVRDDERRGVRVGKRGRVVPDEKLFGRGRYRELKNALSALRRLLRGRRRSRVSRSGHAAVVPLDEREGFLLVEVAGYHDGGVVRRIVRSIELLAIPHGEAADILHPTDRRPAIRMASKGVVVEQLECLAFDVILDAKLAFVGDHFLFGSDLRSAQDEIRHSISLELDEERQRIPGRVLVITGPIGPGRRIGLGARPLHQTIKVTVRARSCRGSRAASRRGTMCGS
jgi:hypothetical protein